MSNSALESMKRIEAICTRFESLGQTGEEPIAAMLLEVEPTERQDLAVALIELDLELRHQRRCELAVQDYRQLLEDPNVRLDEAAVQRLISEARAATQESTSSSVEPKSERYEFIEIIGTGAYGNVWRVVDRQSQRTLAAKVLRNANQKDPHAATRFQREALITGRLQHPGIPPVFDRGELDSGVPFFSMKLVGGSTFESILQQRESPEQDLPLCASIFEQLTQAVAYAHAQGVVHRDLKPHNVMVGDFGEVQVMDWGMARTDDAIHIEGEPSHEPTGNELPLGQYLAGIGAADSSRSLTVEGDVLGTPAFMSPEQARGEKETLDARSDVFSLGAILFQILTNKRVHDGHSSVDALKLTALGDLEAVLDQLESSGAPTDLKDLCRSCLAIDPDHRPANATEVARAVTQYLSNTEQRARQAEIQQREAILQQTESTKRRRVQLFAACAVAIASLLGASAAWWQRQQALDAKEEVSNALALADKRRLQAEKAVDELLFEVSDEQGLIARAPGAQTVRRTLLEKARDYYQELLDESDVDPDLQLKIAKTLARLASTELLIDPDSDKIVQYTDRAIEAVEIRLTEDPQDIEAFRIKSSALLVQNQRLATQERWKEALEKSKEATKILKEANELGDSSADTRFAIAKCIQNQAVAYERLRKIEESAAAASEAISIATPIYEANLDNADYAHQLSRMHNSMAIYYGWRRGKWAECHAEMEKAILLSKAALKLLPTRPDILNDLAMQQMNNAMALTHNRRLEDAKASFQNSVDSSARLAKENPGIPEYQLELSHSQQVQATFYVRHLKRPDLALKSMIGALAVHRSLSESHPKNDMYHEDLIDILSWHGSLSWMSRDKSDKTLEPLSYCESQCSEVIRRIKQRFEMDPSDVKSRSSLAYWMSLDPQVDPKQVLKLTDGLKAYDKSMRPKPTEDRIQSRALALIRADKSNEAIKLLDMTKPKKPKAIRAEIRCLALCESDIDQAKELFEQIKKRKFGPFSENLEEVILVHEIEGLLK